MDKIIALDFGSSCPLCMNIQFTFSGLKPEDLKKSAPGTMAIAKCQGCQNEYWLKLPPWLEEHIRNLFSDDPESAEKIIKKLF